MKQCSALAHELAECSRSGGIVLSEAQPWCSLTIAQSSVSTVLAFWNKSFVAFV